MYTCTLNPSQGSTVRADPTGVVYWVLWSVTVQYVVDMTPHMVLLLENTLHTFFKTMRADPAGVMSHVLVYRP